ncbi:MAG TPA: glycerophosphodiester phosphodiesterase [Chthonomonadaceae bacterium]|nr:glycerophosphodiester phosphodiesterase [Chthonomonadaceae bacterium]
MGLQRVGHRGAPREFPANTLRSFQRAVEHGCGMVECDIRQAADGELVLAHDPEAQDAQGRVFDIAEQTSAFLGALDLGAGEGVPTLAELVDWALGRCAVMADMKCEGGDVEARVVEALRPLPPSAKVVPGAGAASRLRFRALDPALPLSLSLSTDERALLERADLTAWLETLDLQAVTWEHPLLAPERIAACHARGLTVYAWTVDDLPTMRRLLSDGVDGIISNRPDLLAELP